ncbi:MAG: hypothetical protein QNJ77_04780 [Acidimicrobiia bacterium]|nr:hypothetical protein [Acidimicrobiia bacterium]
MQVGIGALTSWRRRRSYWFLALVSALVVIDLWLWVGLAAGLAAGSATAQLVTMLAVGAATVAVVALFAVWRNPVGPLSRAAVTPMQQYSLATHHAGHIVAAYLHDPDRVAKIQLSDSCTVHTGAIPVTSQTGLRKALMLALCGMSAEEIFTGESGAHAEADLAVATSVGADMVGRFGMSGSLVSLATRRSRRATFVDRVLDDARTRKELESLLRDSKRESMRTMLENRHLIVAIRDALQRNQQLTISEIHSLIENAQQARHGENEVLVDLRAATERPRPLLGLTDSR